MSNEQLNVVYDIYQRKPLVHRLKGSKDPWIPFRGFEVNFEEFEYKTVINQPAVEMLEYIRVMELAFNSPNSKILRSFKSNSADFWIPICMPHEFDFINYKYKVA